MNTKFWESVYRDAEKPIIICRDDEAVSIAYVNTIALALFNPSLSFKQEQISAKKLPLGSFLCLSDTNSLAPIIESLRLYQTFRDCPILLHDYTGIDLFVNLSGNTIEVDGQRYFAFYLVVEQQEGFDDGRFYRTMNFIYSLAYSSDDLDGTIQSILNVCGNIAKASRALIMEQTSGSICSNTYEWCNTGIPSMMEQMQNLDYGKIFYNERIDSPLLFFDVNDLSGDDRIFMEAQGIQSISFIPLTYGMRTLGFIGFADCESKRQFNEFDLKLLEATGSVISSLLMRRNARTQNALALNAMQTISDNLGSPILVNRLDTYEVLFANKAMLDAINRHPNTSFESLIGKKCHSLLIPGSTSPCPDCPLSSFQDESGNYTFDSKTREFYASVTRQWFLVKDSIIEWIDGQLVHLESCLDITQQKQNENKYKRLASTDTMTGAFSREWGHEVMETLLKNREEQESPICIAFLDIDGLKQINDTLGHSEGDDMIVRFITIVKKNIRQEDFIIRWGGDEFILLLHGSLPEAEKIMENIKQAVADNNDSLDRPYQIQFSYGLIDFFTTETSYLDEIISMADRKMYLQKKKKKQ